MAEQVAKTSFRSAKVVASIVGAFVLGLSLSLARAQSHNDPNQYPEYGAMPPVKAMGVDRNGWQWLPLQVDSAGFVICSPRHK